MTRLSEGLPARLSDANLSSTYVRPRGGTSPTTAPLPFFNVKDYGALGNNVADDTAAIQAALDAGGVGGRVVLPPGVYNCTSGLTTPTFSSLEGSTTEFGVGGTATTELRFPTITGSTVAIALGVNASLRNLVVRGPGYAVGTCKGITGAAVRLDRITVTAFATGTHLTGGYYSQGFECDWTRNAVGLQLTGCYNVALFAPKFFCGTDATNGTAIVAETVKGLNIFGGSFENYQAAITVGDQSNVNLFGVYFEVMSSLTQGSTLIDVSGRDKVSLLLEGCRIFLNGHATGVQASGATNLTLNAKGNHYVCVAGSQAPTAYNLTAGQDVDLSGDNWGEVVHAGATYTNPAVYGAAGIRIAFPKGFPVYGGTTNDGKPKVDAVALITLSANGAVVIDPLRANTRISLSANATSSSIATAPNNQVMTITWLQDPTGGRTYAWPPTCRFAGGVAPSDTGINNQSSVTFRYDSNIGKWREMSRAIAVPS